MGYGLVHLLQAKRALRPAVSDRAFVVALTMAMSANEVEKHGLPPGHYVGGWFRLSMALGYLTDEHGEPTATGKRAVARALAELRSAGYVKEAPPEVQEHQKFRVYVLLD